MTKKIPFWKQVATSHHWNRSVMAAINGSLIVCLVTASTTRGQDQPATVDDTIAPAATVSSDDTSEPKQLSGPQVGEEVPEARVMVVAKDDSPTAKVDLGEVAKNNPVVIAFMHEKSRPAFQMARVLSEFVRRRSESNAQLYLVVLTDDPSSSEQWLKLIYRYFESPTQLAVAEGGIEGPGPLGLNRLVDMTILVAKDGKVTANFALTQVSASTDAASVLTAINEVAGGGEIPKIEELLPQPQMQRVERRRE